MRCCVHTVPCVGCWLLAFYWQATTQIDRRTDRYGKDFGHFFANFMCKYEEIKRLKFLLYWRHDDDDDDDIVDFKGTM